MNRITERHRSVAVAAAVTAATFLGLGSVAAQGEDLCVPPSYGVPAYQNTKWAGPPKWLAFSDQLQGDPYDQPNDPRWVGASGQSFGAGAASAAGQVRALFAPPDPAVPATRALYLSFTSRVTDVAAPQNLWVGFRVSASESYVVRFRFDRNVDGSGNPTMQGFTECTTRESSCAGNVYTVFKEDVGTTGTCGTVTGSNRYTRFQNEGTGMLGALWLQNTRVWRRTGEWTLNMRVPLLPVGPSAGFPAGIAEASQLYYELGSTTTDAAGGQPWPRTSGAICGILDPSIGAARIFHPTLTAANATPWGEIRINDTTCEGVRPINMGILQDPAVGTDLTSSTLPLQYYIGGTKDDGAGGRVAIKNWFVVQVQNDNRTATINPNELSARFRIADWGVQDVAGSSAVWRDVPVTAGANPSLNTMTVAPTGVGGVAAEWTMSQAQRCEYGVGDPGDACSVSSQLHDVHQCIHVELEGSGAFDFASRGLYQNHDFGRMSIFPREAMIDAAGLPAKPGQTEQLIYLFVNPRNMPAQVAPGTEGAALLAGRAGELAAELRAPFKGLPPLDGNGGNGNGSGSNYDDLQPLPMPYDVPVPWGSVGGPIFRRPIDLKMPRPERDPADAYLPGGLGDAAAILSSIGQVAPNVSAEQIFGELRSTVGPEVLAQIAPTLEIYAFHDTGERDGDGKAILAPMTSFTLFLHHDGPVNGFAWVLDGADRVSDNVYKVHVPIADGRRVVRVRAQAIESTDPTLVGDEHWPCPPPCSGGCCCRPGTCSTASKVSNAGLLGLACMLGLGIRRRRRK